MSELSRGGLSGVGCQGGLSGAGCQELSYLHLSHSVILSNKYLYIRMIISRWFVVPSGAGGVM